MARAKDRVVVAWVHPTQVSAGFTNSMLALHVWDLTHSQRLAGRIARYSSANISNARNWVVRTFLESSTAEWLLFLDADMTFDATLVDDILTNASMTRAPVVGGLCFGVDDGALFPTLYGLESDGAGGANTVRYHDYPPDAMFPVMATGAACLLIHRVVLEKVEAMEAANGNTAYPWFQEKTLNGYPCGEDVTFCLRVAAAGFPLYVDTGVKLGHEKTYVLTEELYMQQRRSAVADAPAVDPSQSAAGEPNTQPHTETGASHG